MNSVKKIIIWWLIPTILFWSIWYYWWSDFLIRKNEAEFWGKRGELIAFIERTKIGISERNEQLKTLKSTDTAEKAKIEEELKNVYDLQANYTQYLKDTPIPEIPLFRDKKQQTYILLGILVLFWYFLWAGYITFRKPKLQLPQN